MSVTDVAANGRFSPRARWRPALRPKHRHCDGHACRRRARRPDRAAAFRRTPLQRLRSETRGRLTGHAWEQVELPLLQQRF